MTKRSNRFLDEAAHSILIGDGAIGTELLYRSKPHNNPVECLNLSQPEVVLGLHRDYVNAGSRIIETNTFRANEAAFKRFGCEIKLNAVIEKGVSLARKAAGDNVYVAGAIGPLIKDVEQEEIQGDDIKAQYETIITSMLNGGVDVLLFETFPDLDELITAVETARFLADDIPIIAQGSFEADGRMLSQHSAESFAAHCIEAGADVLGANCGAGIPSVIHAIKDMLPYDRLLSAYMNAGFAEEVEHRKVYNAPASYLARKAGDLIDLGVHIIGGCCGTGPEIIRAIAETAREKSPEKVSVGSSNSISEPEKKFTTGGEKRKEFHPEKVELPSRIIVELDPPRDLELSGLIEQASSLNAAGADTVTIADNPLASVRVDVMVTAGQIREKTGMQCIPHLTGRDRNRIALQSSIMGAYVLGIQSLLCVTGDPVRMYHEANTSGVFDLNSISLAKMVSEFNEGHRTDDIQRTSFAIGVALNPNVRSLKGQILKLNRKIEAGAHYAVTQPVFEENRLALLQSALDKDDIDIPYHIGILPLISARNADFLHHEVPGIVIPDDIRSRLWRYEQVEDQKREGVDITLELIENFTSYSDRFYFIPQRNKVSSVVSVLESLSLPASLSV